MSFNQASRKRTAPSPITSRKRTISSQTTTDATAVTGIPTPTIFNIPDSVENHFGIHLYLRLPRNQTGTEGRLVNISAENILQVHSRHDKETRSSQHTVVMNIQNDSLLRGQIPSVLQRGFVNYFEPNSDSQSNAAIGMAIFQQRWSDAVHMVLTRHESSSNDLVRQAVAEWRNTMDPHHTLAIFPESYRMERAILKHFVHFMDVQESTSDFGTHGLYADALVKIPSHTKTELAESFQQYIWNEWATKRLQTGGYNTVLGDLVVKDWNRSEKSVVRIDQPEMLQEYTIYDVVLPTLGHDIELYPSYYSDIVIRQMRNMKLERLQGRYRVLVSKPKMVEVFK